MRKQQFEESVYSSKQNPLARSGYQQLNFIQKAYDLVDNPNHSQIIHWSRSGQTFIIENIQRFQRELLPHYFRHNRYQSFVRQLNMYDFHKIRNGQYYCQNKSQFRHDQFTRGNLEAILQIKRKGFQAKIKQKQNTKIKKNHRIMGKKNLKKKSCVPPVRVVPKKAKHQKIFEEQNSFFGQLPRINPDLNFSLSLTVQSSTCVDLSRIVGAVVSYYEKSRSLVLEKRNRAEEIIELADIVKEKWLQVHDKNIEIEDMDSLKKIYYGAKQMLNQNAEDQNEGHEKMKVEGNKRIEEVELYQTLDQENAIIQSIFVSEIKSTLICITSDIFLNATGNKKMDTLIWI